MIKNWLHSKDLSRSSATNFIATVLIGILAALAFIGIQRASEFSKGTIPESFLDFDVFYLVSEMVWKGEIHQAYYSHTMRAAQETLSGDDSFMPWTYPPQFNLLIAPLSLVPPGVAYSIFVIGTFIVYLLTLKVFAKEYFGLAIILLFPVIAITLLGGQNGFLTGTLIGLTCLGFQNGRAIAGLPLGLMIIKPHLAVAFAVYTLISRHWRSAAVAAAVVIATSALATALLGFEIWTAFVDGLKETRAYLGKGEYPLHRMVSAYAASRTLGVPATVAMAVQIVVAVLSLLLVSLACRRGVPLRQSLGLAAIASLLISPYAYDYDLAIYGIGIALLLPDIIRLGGRLERLSLYGLSFVTSAFGFAQSHLKISLDFTGADRGIPLSLAGLTLIALLGLVWRIVRRDWEEHRGPDANGYPINNC
ncbi:glycosyltransferase family 87 protein [Microvirga arabica]|uniref:glycosyltransferase family 87 protein n=1 Tax=Microvirga arabica TaxID=1128671 RepID=UPI0019392941|nr:glycosyltransferase family 87 protein [Microvirga arabica]MBM1172041.1 DUF2029 domain-containing protein [Microvirga arabica]